MSQVRGGTNQNFDGDLFDSEEEVGDGNVSSHGVGKRVESELNHLTRGGTLVV
jgi:hypothetical protein